MPLLGRSRCVRRGERALAESGEVAVGVAHLGHPFAPGHVRRRLDLGSAGADECRPHRTAPHRTAPHRAAPPRSGRNPPVGAQQSRPNATNAPQTESQRELRDDGDSTAGRRDAVRAPRHRSGRTPPVGAQQSRPNATNAPQTESQRQRRDDGATKSGPTAPFRAQFSRRGAILPLGRNSLAPRQRTRPKPASQRERRDDDATKSGPSAPFGAQSFRWGAPVPPQRNERAPNPRDGGLSGEIAEAAASRDARGTVGYRKISGNSRSSGVPGTAA